MITVKKSNFIYPLVVMTAIFVLSGTHGYVINNAGLGAESLHINGHFVLFFMLAVAFYKFVPSIPMAILLSVVYAFLDEFHQSFVPGRSASWLDIGVDTIGSIIAGIILWKLQFILPKSLRTWLNK